MQLRPKVCARKCSEQLQKEREEILGEDSNTCKGTRL